MARLSTTRRGRRSPSTSGGPKARQAQGGEHDPQAGDIDAAEGGWRIDEQAAIGGEIGEPFSSEGYIAASA